MVISKSKVLGNLIKIKFGDFDYFLIMVAYLLCLW